MRRAMADLRIETPQQDVRVLVMARGAKRNALTLGLIGALQAEVRAAEADGLRSVVITGEGPAFSAGADFADLEGDASDREFDAAMSGLTSALQESRLISIAAIDGFCIGAGFDLAMACDFRVAGPDAAFGLPAVSMGILYNPKRLAQVLPRLADAAAMRLLLLAERLDRSEAQAAGIVTHCAEGGTLGVAIGLAGRAAKLPPNAQAAAKAFLTAFRWPDFDETEWEMLRMELLSSEERREALRQARTTRR